MHEACKRTLYTPCFVWLFDCSVRVQYCVRSYYTYFTHNQRASSLRTVTLVAYSQRGQCGSSLSPQGSSDLSSAGEDQQYPNINIACCDCVCGPSERKTTVSVASQNTIESSRSCRRTSEHAGGHRPDHCRYSRESREPSRSVYSDPRVASDPRSRSHYSLHE